MTRLRQRFTLIELTVLVAMTAIAVSMIGPRACRSAPSQPPSSTPAGAAPPADADATARVAALAAQLEPPSKEWRDGMAAVVLVDVSGSMAERVGDAGGQRRRKIVIAQRAALDLVGAFETYARAHPAEAVSVGVYEFSERDDEKAARVVVPPGPPDVAGARARLEAMKAQGGTPIGEAMIEARRALDATGLRRRHLLVITDGENTRRPVAGGGRPGHGSAGRSHARGALFRRLRRRGELLCRGHAHGGLLLSAKDGAELRTTLDDAAERQILVEAPRP